LGTAAEVKDAIVLRSRVPVKAMQREYRQEDRSRRHTSDQIMMRMRRYTQSVRLPLKFSGKASHPSSSWQVLAFQKPASLAKMATYGVDLAKRSYCWTNRSMSWALRKAFHEQLPRILCTFIICGWLLRLRSLPVSCNIIRIRCDCTGCYLMNSWNC
jgi:hypothetical protein